LAQPSGAPPPAGAELAQAGSNQTVAAGVTVQLDGSKSSDADGDTLGFAWEQTDGPAVTLNGADSATGSRTMIL
jgi:chitinase